MLKRLSLSNENWKQIVSNYELGQTCGIHSPNLSYSRDSREREGNFTETFACVQVYVLRFVSHTHTSSW